MATATTADESYEDAWIATSVSDVENFLDQLADQLDEDGEDDTTEIADTLRELAGQVQDLLDKVQDEMYSLDQLERVSPQ